MRAALQASRRQRRGKCGGFFRQFAPGYGAPDAAALFADGRTFTPLPGVMQRAASEKYRGPNSQLSFAAFPKAPTAAVARRARLTKPPTECRNAAIRCAAIGAHRQANPSAMCGAGRHSARFLQPYRLVQGSARCPVLVGDDVPSSSMTGIEVYASHDPSSGSPRTTKLLRSVFARMFSSEPCLRTDRARREF